MTKDHSSNQAQPDASRLLKLLQDPTLYPHQPKQLQTVQTHGSLVIIAKPFVYKIKKPVDFGFLNYSTLALRKLNLERELAFNQKLAPDVYLEVKPLFVQSGRLSWTDGELVEWVLVMRYLPKKWFLDQWIQRGAMQAGVMDRVGGLLSEFYGHSENQSSRRGTIAYLRTAIRNNFRLTKNFAGDLVPSYVHASLRRHARQGFVKFRDILNLRMQHAWRWCHGDLHLDHIHVTPEAIRIYDCIEFNDGLRWIDFANDLAFLAMDLDFYGRSDLSRRLIQQSALRLKDASMFQVVDFYKTYRAMVRAKVESLQVYPSDVDHPQKGRIEKRRRAESYFRLALDYAVTGRRPVIFVIMGNIGTGKSTAAKNLAESLGGTHLNSDRVRKELAGIAPTHRSNAEERHKLYRPSVTKKIYATLRDRALECVQQDQSVVLDATYGQAAQRALLEKACGKVGATVRWIELTAPDTVILRRLRGRDRASNVVSDARSTDFETLTKKYDSPGDSELDVLIRIPSRGRAETVMKRILDGLIDLQMDQVLASK